MDHTTTVAEPYWIIVRESKVSPLEILGPYTLEDGIARRVEWLNCGQSPEARISSVLGAAEMAQAIRDPHLFESPGLPS